MPTHTTPRLQPVDYPAGDECHSSISAPSRSLSTASDPRLVNQDIITTPRPQPIDYSGDEGHLTISVPSQSPFTSAPQTPGDTDAWNKGAAQDNNIGNEEVPSISLFQGSSNFQISNTNINAVGGNATIIQLGNGQFTEIQRNLICDYIANLTMRPNIEGNLKKHILTQSIITLPRARAVFDDYQNRKKNGPCFEGTRVALLREMAGWITGSGDSRIYVLSGLAGIGKSTVAYTIASRAAALNLLGASFFFSRDETDRKNAERFFTTIAYQLCLYSETFSKAIGDVLMTERGSAATTKDPQEQLQVLILAPLRSIVHLRPRPILIVIDALDECDEEDAFSILTGLRQLVQDLPSFKVILTTRPRPYLDLVLASQGDYQIFHLQDIEDKVVDGDIKLYLQHSLSLKEVQRRHLKRQWCASDEEIDYLVHAAGRLFIVASTAMRYILDKSVSNPAAQMRNLLQAFTQNQTSFKDLDDFYMVILRNVVPVDCDNDYIISRYQSVVGAVIFVQRPLPVSTLSQLIDIEMEDIHAVLDNLQSVILLGNDDVPRIYHKSFPDYLMNQARCKDPRLRIDPRTQHGQIASHCFKIMNKNLKYNILSLGDPARFMSNEDGLKEAGITNQRLEEMVTQHLRYACIYWANHLEAAIIENLMDELVTLMDEHLLHWFEVLSLIGTLDSAHRAILKLLKLTSLDLHLLLYDALRFIGNFYEIIKRSALHTYHSALLFTTTDSLIYRRYVKKAMHNICSVEGMPEQWDPLVASLSHGIKPDAVTFSLDSTLFVSCSEDDHGWGKLKIWDAATGIPISIITGVRFAVANDFSAVASSKGNTITLYNVNGSARGTIFTTSSTIRKLAFSSESNRVAATLSDGTVWLWNSRNVELIDKFQDCEYSTQLEFSATGTRLAYLTTNNIVKLRDGISGKFIADLQCGSGLYVCRFVFSGDGSRLASWSYDRGFKLTLWNMRSVWDNENNPFIGTVAGNYYKLTISPHSPSLLAAYEGGNVTLWEENHSHLAQIDTLETGFVRGMAFSTDNMLAIATYDLIKLYNTKTHSFISTYPFCEGSMTLAFSPDCSRLAVGKYDGSVYLWDIRGINISSSSLEEQTTSVTALALSRDCARLACGFMDGTVELCKTTPTKQRIWVMGHTTAVTALAFSPDCRLFAAGLNNGTIELRNGENGSLHGIVKMVSAPQMALRVVALSNTILAAADCYTVTKLWNLDTLDPIFTFPGRPINADRHPLSISDDGALVAVATAVPIEATYSSNPKLEHHSILLLDVVNRTTIATFNDPFDVVHTTTFLPNNSRLVAQSKGGDFLSLNLHNNGTMKGPIHDHLIQLPNTPLWHGIPIWHCQEKDQHYFSALFPQHKSPVPVLCVPSHLRVKKWTQGSSMIALGCEDGRVILIRLSTSHVN